MQWKKRNPRRKETNVGRRSRKKEKNPEQLSHSYQSGYIFMACW